MALDTSTNATTRNTDAVITETGSSKESKNENLPTVSTLPGQPSPPSGSLTPAAFDHIPHPPLPPSSSGAAPLSPPLPPDAKSEGPIKYRIEIVDLEDNLIHQYDTNGPHTEGYSNPAQRTVFTIVTTYRTVNKLVFKGEEPSGIAPIKSMHISSKAVEHSLRSVVDYYPGQDLASDVIKIQYPYAILVHHYDRLIEYRERFNPEKLLEDSEVCFRDKDAYEHLGVLKDFLDEEIMPAVNEERERNKRGMATFDMLWVNKEPGKTFVGDLGSAREKCAGIVHSIEGGSFFTPSVPWVVTFWNLQYGGDTVGRKLSKYRESKFTGERKRNNDIIDLDEHPRSEAAEECIQDGKIFWSLLEKQCKYYKGKTKSFPHNEVDGLVMCDMDAYYEGYPQYMPLLMQTTTDNRTWVSDCTCSVCSKRRVANTEKEKIAFDDFQTIFVEGQELNDHQYLLLPSTINAYVFRTRTWEELHVSGFSEPKYDTNMINNLVMNPKRVDLIKALAKSFARVNKHGELSTRAPWSADFVKGKGNGLIFLLHGKPGVGKTCTAECIAEYTSRPLMVLTSSDIGTSPGEVELHLTDHFKRARRWGAVLLIDEADVFMERRSTADLVRNSLVAGFLRALEFYDGILFLTTNRVGSFDDAFISRIHVHLYYPDFDEESRAKVWKTFIDKLERERGDYIRLSLKAEEYIEGDEIKAVKWNGRDIRNAFQTAVSLAEYESTKDKEGMILLTDKHLKSVVEMSRDFKVYLDELHAGDEGKRAERRFERLNK